MTPRTYTSDHLGNEVVPDSGHFIVFFSHLLHGLLQRVDVHLLRPQTRLGGLGLSLLGPGRSPPSPA